jgi:hypothetical protein
MDRAQVIGEFHQFPNWLLMEETALVIASRPLVCVAI